MALSAHDVRVMGKGLALTGAGILLIALGTFVFDALLEGTLREVVAGTTVILGVITVFVALTLLVIPPLLPAKPRT